MRRIPNGDCRIPAARHHKDAQVHVLSMAEWHELYLLLWHTSIDLANGGLEDHNMEKFFHTVAKHIILPGDAATWLALNRSQRASTEIPK